VLSWRTSWQLVVLNTPLPISLAALYGLQKEHEFITAVIIEATDIIKL
jgi:hypothetical protein